jgi:hypothetical protein
MKRIFLVGIAVAMVGGCGVTQTALYRRPDTRDLAACERARGAEALVPAWLIGFSLSSYAHCKNDLERAGYVRVTVDSATAQRMIEQATANGQPVLVGNGAELAHSEYCGLFRDRVQDTLDRLAWCRRVYKEAFAQQEAEWPVGVMPPAVSGATSEDGARVAMPGGIKSVAAATSGGNRESFLIVDATPGDAEVFLDGRRLGAAGELIARAFLLSSGRHDVAIVAHGFRPYVARFATDPRFSVRIRVDLAPQPGPAPTQ